jgi:hypothetical protein
MGGWKEPSLTGRVLPVFLLAIAITAQSVAGPPTPATLGTYSYPRVGNLFEDNPRTEYAATFSKWDIVGFTASAQDLSPDVITAVKRANPDATLLAYIPAAYIWASYPSAGPLVENYYGKLTQENWWLRDNRGNRIGQAGRLWFLNLTTKCPRDGTGEIFAQWLGHYIAREIMGTGYWHGVILDGVDEDIRWLNSSTTLFSRLPAGVDCDRDGVADNPDSLFAWWKAGVEILLATLRADAGGSCIIVPNGINYMYQYANGGIREDFPHMHGGWQENMFAPYGYMNDCANFLHEPMNATLMLCYWRDGAGDRMAPPETPEFQQFARFTLASALLGDGYYFLDGGAAGSLWWLDYYDLDLGAPTGAAYLDTIVNRLTNSPCTIWRREFTNATVYCNPSQSSIKIDDGTVLLPEDGAIKVHNLPGPVSCSILKTTLDRTLVSRQRSMGADVAVRNTSAKAAMAYVWVDLMKQGKAVASGGPTERIIGASGADTLRVSLDLKSTLGPGTYCLRVSVGGPGRVITGQDTAWVTKVNDHGKKVGDRSQRPLPAIEDSLAVFPQPIPLSGARPLTLRANGISPTEGGTQYSIQIYDVTGRLAGKSFEGRLEDGQAVVIGDGGMEGLPKAPGVYFLRFETGNRVVTKRIVFLR